MLRRFGVVNSLTTSLGILLAVAGCNTVGVEQASPGDQEALSTSKSTLNSRGFRQSNMIGTFNPNNGIWRLKVQSPGTPEDPSLTMQFMYGNPGDVPLVGDWDGDGVQTQGVWRNSIWYLANSLGGGADIAFMYGNPDHIPLVGDWDGNGTATPGVFKDGTFYLRNSNATGPGEFSFNFGAAGDIPIAGDWDGDGVDTVGVYRPSEYRYYLINRNETRAPDVAYYYGGDPTDRPVVGDWNNTGLLSPGVKRGSTWHLQNGFAGNSPFPDTFGDPGDLPIVGNWRPKVKRYRQGNLIGSFDPTTAMWRLKLQPAGTVEDKALRVEFMFGDAGDTPIVGDWDGDGIQTQGVRRGSTWYLANVLGGGAELAFDFGDSDALPVVGDWNGDGIATPGVFKNGTFFLRNTNSAGDADIAFYFGNPGDIPVVGDWDGNGVDTIGVYRPSTHAYYLTNRNETGIADVATSFGGDPSDVPIVGDWNNSGRPSPGVKRGSTWLLQNGFGSGSVYSDTFGGTGDIPIVGNWKATAVNNQMYSPTRETWTTSPFVGTYGNFFADVTGDGKDDAIASTSTGVIVRRSLGLSLGGEETWTSGAYNGNYGSYVGDVTGDKVADIVKISSLGVEYRASNKNGFDPAVSVSTVPFYYSRGTFLADVDGVNGADLIVVDRSSIRVRKFTRCPTGTCLGAEETFLTGGFSYTYRFFADMDNDKRADAVGVSSNGRVYVRRNNGTSFGALETWSTEPFTTNTAATTNAVIVRDFTGDGAADLVVVNSNEIYMRRSNRFALGSNEALAVQPSVGTLTAAAEFSGDGRPEIVEVSSSAGLKVTRSPGHQIGLRFIHLTPYGSQRTSDEWLDREINWTNTTFSPLDINFKKVGNHIVAATDPDDPNGKIPLATLVQMKNFFNPGCYVADIDSMATVKLQTQAFAMRCALPNEIIVFVATINEGSWPWVGNAVYLAGCFNDWVIPHELGHYFGLVHSFETTSPYEWDLVYTSAGSDQRVGFNTREEAFANTTPLIPVSKYHDTSHWCYPGQPGCPTTPSGYTLVVPVEDSQGTTVDTYTGSNILKGTSWRLSDGTPTYNVMGYAYNYLAGAGAPAFSLSQIQLIRRRLAVDERTAFRAKDGSILMSGRPTLGNLR